MIINGEVDRTYRITTRKQPHMTETASLIKKFEQDLDHICFAANGESPVEISYRIEIK